MSPHISAPIRPFLPQPPRGKKRGVGQPCRSGLIGCRSKPHPKKKKKRGKSLGREVSVPRQKEKSNPVGWRRAKKRRKRRKCPDRTQARRQKKKPHHSARGRKREMAVSSSSVQSRKKKGRKRKKVRSALPCRAPCARGRTGGERKRGKGNPSTDVAYYVRGEKKEESEKSMYSNCCTVLGREKKKKKKRGPTADPFPRRELGKRGKSSRSAAEALEGEKKGNAAPRGRKKNTSICVGGEQKRKEREIVPTVDIATSHTVRKKRKRTSQGTVSQREKKGTAPSS